MFSNGNLKTPIILNSQFSTLNSIPEPAGGGWVAASGRRYGRGCREAGGRPYGGGGQVPPFSNVFKWQFENTTIIHYSLFIFHFRPGVGPGDKKTRPPCGDRVWQPGQGRL